MTVLWGASQRPAGSLMFLLRRCCGDGLRRRLALQEAGGFQFIGGGEVA